MNISNFRKPEIIVTRTPLRISFAGGGTDLPDFYSKESGAVLSTTIDKFIYVTVKRHSPLFEEQYRINYSETEHVNNLDDMKNTIARECLKLLKVPGPLYISTVADLPASSGLGSSSSFAIGLLQALHAYHGEFVNAGQLAEEASHIEIEMLKRPIGKQDQYAAAFGGLNYFRFQQDGRVSVEQQTLSNVEIQLLFDHLLVFWTNITRDAGAVLSEQKSKTTENLPLLLSMREHAESLRTLMHQKFEPLAFGEILDASWRLKRKLASTISNAKIDTWYDKAIQAGSIGGKLCGAGGGGFFCFVVPPEKKASVRAAFASELTEVAIQYEPLGSRLLFVQ